MPTTNLTPQQHQAIEALSAGTSTSAAAQLCGVHRNTISEWRRSSAAFRAALTGAQYEAALLVREQAEELTQAAFATIRALLADPKAPASVRLRAALAIIEKTSTPPPPQPEILHTLGSLPLPEPALPKIVHPEILHDFAHHHRLHFPSPPPPPPLPPSAATA